MYQGKRTGDFLQDGRGDGDKAEQEMPQSDLWAVISACAACGSQDPSIWHSCDSRVFVHVIFDREALKGADYALLVTFISFFVLIGNLGRISLIREALEHFVSGREILTGVLASQVISNVPAAVLLSGFTENYRDLLVGVNLGGLGTLIASMASLISFKLYTKCYKENRGRYLRWFTLVNIIYLFLLLTAALYLYR